MYSEHLIAALLDVVEDRYGTGEALDADRGRDVVTVGRIAGPLLGWAPSDAALVWEAANRGAVAAVGTRGAVHTMAGGRCAMGLGRTRGAVETIGNRLVHLTTFDPSRYTGAYYLPGVYYGGLI